MRVMKHYSTSFVIWNGFNFNNHNQFFNNISWSNWLEIILNTKNRRNVETYQSLIFGIVLDVIRRNMNDFVFNMNIHSTQASIIRINHQFDAFRSCLDRDAILLPQIHLSIENSSEVWSPPAHGIWSLNCDASVNSNGRVAGCGGILHDHHGNFIFAFAHRIHPCSVMEAELRGILHGLTIA